MVTLPLLVISLTMAAEPDKGFLVDAPVLRTAYPHEQFGRPPGGSGWIEARVTTLLLAHALDHLIYMDMPPPPGELLPELGEEGAAPGAAGVRPGPMGPPPGGSPQPNGPPGPPPSPGQRPEALPPPGGAPPRHGAPAPSPRTAPARRRRWRLAAAMLLVACGTAAPPVARVDGRTWTAAGVSVDFPAGWQVTTTAAHLRSGLPHVILEGSQSDVQLAISWVPRPSGGPSTALDGLLELTPLPAVGSTVRRLPGCSAAIQRVVESDPQVVQVAVAVADGLLLGEAWGAADAASQLASLMCRRDRS